MKDRQSLTVSLIQSDLFWEDKEANLNMFESKIGAVPDSAELIVLPEMFPTGFSMNATALAESMEGATIGWMRRMSAKKKAVLTGSVIIKENDRYFNRLIWMLPTGDYGYYDKRHLFSFADEDQHYTAGNKRLIASLKGWKINLQICYDLRFPIWTYQPLDENGLFDLYLNVASWPESRSNHWRTLLSARAIENQAYVIGVNRVGTDGNGHRYSGDSSVISPMGEILYQKKDAEDVFTCTLSKDRLAEIRTHFPILDDAESYRILES